jgi:uncharacterized protein (TIGR02246 family)
VSDRAPTTDDRVAAIRSLVAEAQATQLDVEPFVALHEPGGIVVNVAGRRVLGRDALQAAMEQALATPLRQVLTTADIDDIRFVRPDVAIVSCSKHLDDRRDGSSDDSPVTFPPEARLTYVVVENGDHWRIALAQTTPIAS